MKRALLLAALACSGCATLGLQNPMPGIAQQVQAATGNKQCTRAELQKYEMTPDSEYWFGRSVADRIIASFTKNDANAVYPPDSVAAIYLNEVGQLAVDAAERNRDDGGGPTGAPRRFAHWTRVDDMPDRPPPEYGYHFILVKSPSPGAWGIPGGFIIVTDSLVQRAASEDQLAGILAHEVAHVQRGHGVEAVKKAMCAQEDSALKSGAKELGQTLQSVAVVDLSALVDLLNKAAQDLSDQLTDTGYGFPYEYEADAYGTRYLYTTGYSPLAISDYLRRVKDDPAFSTANSKTHPPAEDRAIAVENEVKAENLQPGHSPNENDRISRFVKAMIAGHLRPDWTPRTDPASAPLLPGEQSASAK